MKRTFPRVADLADEAGLDVEETLILLWDAGLDRYDVATSTMLKRDVDRARHAVGLGGIHHFGDKDYWQELFRMDLGDFESLLMSLEIRSSLQARRLPRGAIKKLRRWAKRAGRLAEPVVLVEAPILVDPTPAYEWRQVGRHNRTTSLSVEEIESIHWQLVEDFKADDDPIEPAGVRSGDLLASAAFRPETAIGENRKYGTAELAAAALVHSLVHDHPFFNGNKRTAMVAMLVQLDRSNMTLTCPEKELFRFILRVAQHRVVPQGSGMADREVTWIAEWICKHSRDVDKAERTLQWRRLRRLLNDFDCKFETLPGNRANISRTVVAGKTFLGRPRSRLFRTQVQYAGDGTDAVVSTIKKIRADLELDDEHGIDSLVFYEARPEELAEGFIVKYRKTLRRLASL